MKSNLRKFTYLTGLTGIGIIVLGSIITAISYTGRNGEPYSFLNHFISELGEIGVSELAPVFNTSLIIGGIFLLFFMLGLGLYFRNIFAYVASAVGLFCGIAASLVGVFPMNNMAVHVKVALSFFRSGLLAILLFTLVIIFDKQRRVSKWLVIPGVITVLAFTAFLYLPQVLEPGQALTLQPEATRPAFWLSSFLEWVVFLTVLVWISVVSIYLIKHRSYSPTTKTTSP